ncbi:MAG: family 10 glycosylhydrolase [Aeromicrobium sp.]|nr:family 10 glycosylhydrolase [Burkholderiales bacterium]
MVYQSLVAHLLRSEDAALRKPKKSLRLLAAAALVVIASCADTGPKPEQPISEPPVVQREFRAVWVASVANIDWPSRRDLTVAQQQAEIIATVERVRELNMNAIVLQVRTSADALYESNLEPWSEYLTGTQGKAPDPYYDPLKMWVDEAHKRGIELHAWFNPYRARHTQAKSPNAKTHIANTNPRAVKSYGGFLWMDPGETAASEQTLNVILDVVNRYDIDGVHIDDYFYPYPVPVPGTDVPLSSPDDTPQPRAELPFPDERAWQAYLLSGGKLARADWRRQNVNTLIEKIYAGIKREKPHVKFGISPFGLGKPDKRPPGIAGFSQYDKLYADAELWLQKGWLDYFTPQLYWPIDQAPQAYGVLLDYWAKENTAGRHLWPGIYLTRIQAAESQAKSWAPSEIVSQIMLTRGRQSIQPMTTGHVHFSMVGLTQNRRGVNEELAKLYTTPALVPASPWLSRTPPAPPIVQILRRGDRAELMVGLDRNHTNFTHVVWVRQGERWRLQLLPSRGEAADFLRETQQFDLTALPDVVVWSMIDRFGNESPRVSITAAQMRAAKVGP